MLDYWSLLQYVAIWISTQMQQWSTMNTFSAEKKWNIFESHDYFQRGRLPSIYVRKHIVHSSDDSVQNFGIFRPLTIWLCLTPCLLCIYCAGSGIGSNTIRLFNVSSSKSGSWCILCASDLIEQRDENLFDFEIIEMKYKNIQENICPEAPKPWQSSSSGPTVTW